MNTLGRKLRSFSELEPEANEAAGNFSRQTSTTAFADDVDNDQLSEPLFKLIDEVFELRGMLKVFRHSLMTFLRSRYHVTLRLSCTDVSCSLSKVKKEAVLCLVREFETSWDG